MPIPTHFWGLTINDLGLTLDKRSVNYGEAQGLPYVPVGLYDWAGRLVDTTHTDFNGFYEALEPSTRTYNCPVPAGPCPNMYRFTGNDPGQPGDPEPGLQPAVPDHRDELPGAGRGSTPSPTGADPGGRDRARARTPRSPTRPSATSAPTDPQLLAVDRPYVRPNDAGDDRTVTVTGTASGPTGPGVAQRVGSTTAVTTTSWTDTSIIFTVPACDDAVGPRRSVRITNGAGRSSYNGLDGLEPRARSPAPSARDGRPTRVAEVGPGKQYAHGPGGARGGPSDHRRGRYWLVVVWPGRRDGAQPAR